MQNDIYFDKTALRRQNCDSQTKKSFGFDEFHKFVVFSVRHNSSFADEDIG